VTSYITDALFEKDADGEFQDIWISHLSKTEYIDFYNFALRSTAPDLETYPDSLRNDDELYEFSCSLSPLVFDGEQFPDVTIRIQNLEVAIDFDTGLNLWPRIKQSAFIAWLAELRSHFPAAQFWWTLANAQFAPDTERTALLRYAMLNSS